MAHQKDDIHNDPQLTSRYGMQGPDRTDVYGPQQPPGDPGSRRSPSLLPGQSLTLKGTLYEVLEIISHNTLEANVYRIKNSTGQAYALKLYHSFTDPNKEPNAEVLTRIRAMEHPDILKLHEYGVGTDKYLDQHCFEICTFAEGGDMFSDPHVPGQKMDLPTFKAKYTPAFVEKVVVPELFNGIQKLHEADIVHCDLKPSNIFYHDKTQQDILIGDYGSAKSYNTRTADSATITERLQGTPFFQSPEHKHLVVSFKTDYYSLGAILIQLLYPEQIGKQDAYWELDPAKGNAFFTRLMNNHAPIDFNPSPPYGRLNLLIRGLIQLSPQSRFGADEVASWLKGQDPALPSANPGIAPIKVGENTAIHTESDFVRYLEQGQDAAGILVKDKTTYEIVKIWLQQTYNQKRREHFERIAAHVGPLGDAYLQEALLRFFRPKRPVVVAGHSFAIFDAPHLPEAMADCIEALDRLWKKSNAIAIKPQLFQLEFCLIQLAAYRKGTPSALEVNALMDKAYAAFGTQQDPAGPILHLGLDQSGDEGLLSLFYAFQPDRGFRDADSRALHHIEDIAHYFAENPDRFDHPLLKVELQQYLNTHGPKNLSTKTLNTFLLQALKAHATTQVTLANVTVNRKREYQITYGYEKNLNEYLHLKSLEGNYAQKIKKDQSFTHRRGLFETSASVFNRFLNSLLEKHHISQLGTEHLQQLRSQFFSQVAKQYLHLYAGQMLALACLVPLWVFTYALATQRLRIDHRWRFSSSPKYISFEEARSPKFDTVVTTYYRASQTANLRQNASKDAPVLTTVPVGDEIIVLNQHLDPWIFVLYQGQKGYISARLIRYSREERFQIPKAQQ